MNCSVCGCSASVSEMDADDRCSICSALSSLRETLIRRGFMKPNLPGIDYMSTLNQLPPGDRE